MNAIKFTVISKKHRILNHSTWCRGCGNLVGFSLNKLQVIFKKATNNPTGKSFLRDFEWEIMKLMLIQYAEISALKCQQWCCFSHMSHILHLTSSNELFHKHIMMHTFSKAVKLRKKVKSLQAVWKTNKQKSYNAFILCLFKLIIYPPKNHCHSPLDSLLQLQGILQYL